MDLNFEVNKQTIKRTDKEAVANLSENYLTLNFTFDDDWSNLAKFILILDEDGDATRLVINQDKVTIPSSLLTGKKLMFSLYGTESVNNTVKRITTHETSIQLLKSGYTNEYNNPIDESDVDLVEQIFLAIDGKSDIGHTHDDRYYTETEVNVIIKDLMKRITRAPFITPLLVDTGVSGTATDLFKSMTNFTRENDGTRYYYVNSNSSIVQTGFNNSVNFNGNEVAIDFDITNCTGDCSFQTTRMQTGENTEYQQVTLNSTGKVHIELRNDGTYVYLEGEIISSDKNERLKETFNFYFRCLGNSTADFKYKDFRIYYL